MLILSRKVDEEIFLDLPDGTRIRIAICDKKRNDDRVRIGIEAPPEIKIMRAELEQRAAAAA